MILSEKYRFLFIHVPKTGGSTIRRWLREYTQNDPLVGIWKNHFRLGDVQHALHDGFYNSLFKFAFVRNTWDRLVSNYFFLRKLDDENHWTVDAKALPFKEYIRANPMPSQLNWINNEQQEVGVNYIGRFETFERDWTEIAKRIRVPFPRTLFKENVSKHRHYSSYYDDDTR